jgi:solute:Na+ symporter, SSS family
VNHSIEYTVIACYLAFLIVIGAAFHRFNKNVSDYFRSGCRGTWWLVGASVFMGGITANSFTSSAGVAYKAGWSVALIYIGNSCGYLVNAAFMAGWFRQLRATTSPEVIRMRFGPVTQQVYAIHGVLTGVLGAGITLWAVAAFSSSVFGFKLSTIVVVLGCVGIAYSIMGGLWGVMATDFVQGMILLPMTILITVLCLNRIGGIGGFFRLVREKSLEQTFSMIHGPGEYKLRAFTLGWAIAMIVKQTWDQNALSVAGRYFAVKDGDAARKAAMVAVVMMLLGAVFWFIPPMTARMLYEKETMAAPLHDPTEASFAVAALHVLPGGMIGLMAVAIFAATLSSLDTGLNRNAAVAMRDIYPLLCRLMRRPLADERRQLLLSRLVTAFFGACIVSCAIYFSNLSGRGIFDIILKIGVLLSLPLTVPLMWAMFVRRVPAWSALFSAGTGLCYSWVITHLSFELSFQQGVFGGLLVGSSSFLVTRFFWSGAPADYREQVEAFFTRMHTPVDFEKEVGQANDYMQLRMIGWFTVAVAAFIGLLLLIPNNLTGRLSILFVAGTVMAMGIALTVAGYRRRKSAGTEDRIGESELVRQQSEET